MSILITVLIILVILALVLWVIRMLPLPSPLNWIIQILAVVIAIFAIGNRAGLF